MAATLEDIQRIIDRQTKDLEEKFSEKLQALRDDVSSVRDTVQNISVDIADLKERTQSLEQTTSRLTDKHTELTDDVEDLQEELRELRDRYAEELDKLEAFSRRDNLRLFGIAETPGETFDSCAAKVAEHLQNTVPGKTWCEDDFVRVHRLGKNPSFADMARDTPRSRPMIVKFARWKDKMAVLTKGRDALKKKGINVAGDLTTRQHDQIRIHREKGLRAYYKGNKLVVAGPLQDANRNDNRNRDRADNFIRRRPPPDNSEAEILFPQQRHGLLLHSDQAASGVSARDTRDTIPGLHGDPTPRTPKRPRRSTPSPTISSLQSVFESSQPTNNGVTSANQ